MVVYSNKWDYKKKLKEIEGWDIPEDEKEYLVSFANEYASGRITGRIGKNVDGTIEDALIKLKLPLTKINKSVDDMQRKDVEKFVDDLIQNKIKKKLRKRVNGRLRWVNNGDYAKKGKDKFLKTLSLYFKFRLKKQPDKLTEFLEVTKVIITHVEEEVFSLTYKQFDKLYESCNSLSDRFYLIVNCWGGFRASEFHGITKEDIHLPNINKGEEFVKIWIRHGNSKTKGRMVSLYGGKCYKVVKEYLDQRHLKPGEIVYEKTHNSRKIWLRRMGEKCGIKGLHPHGLRSTCATWLVDKGILNDYTDLCVFFGWAFGSPVPKKYLNRSRIKLRGIEDKVKNTKIEKVERELEQTKEKFEMEKIKVEQFEKKQEKQKQEIDQKIKDLSKEFDKKNKRTEELNQEIEEYITLLKKTIHDLK